MIDEDLIIHSKNINLILNIIYINFIKVFGFDFCELIY